MLDTAVPTDNLYKFIAIAGLLIYVASGLLPDLHIEAINSELYRIKAQQYELDDPCYTQNSDIADADWESPEWTNDRIGREKYVAGFCSIEKQLKAWIAMTPGIKDKENWFDDKIVRRKTMADKGFTDEQYNKWLKTLSLEEFQRMMKPKIERAKSLLPKVYQQRLATERAWELIDRRDRYKTMSWVGLAIGSIGVAAGFGAWYTKVQRPQDQLLLADIAARTASKESK